MSREGFVIPVDPSELANRFPAPDAYEEPLEEDDDGRDHFEDLNEILAMLPLLPAREADLLELYYVHKKRQADLAVIFGVTQAAISYRLGRAIDRIKFIRSVPRVSEEQIRADLEGHLRDALDMEILVGMWKTSCQSEVARQLKITQGRVRHRLWRALKLLNGLAERDSDKFKKYYEIFHIMVEGKHFNILRQVFLPQWHGTQTNDAK